MALAPPLTFDETLYHLPFIRALATSGTLRVVPDVRFAAMPQLHELLCVPMYLLVSDVATHLVALAELLITAALLFDWGRRNGALATALFLGSPIVLQLATITYVDVALMLFVAAGFYCLDREQHLLSGFFFGTACSVKYLGGYFAVAALVVVLVKHRRRLLAFAASCAAAALPTTLWLTWSTGDPLHPFLTTREWFTSQVAPTRLLWDVTFARERVGQQPPMTPFLALIVILVLAAALRDWRARAVALIAAGYVAVFAFLPQDSRYLIPLLPLLCITAAMAAGQRARWLPWIAVAPGMAYAFYRLFVMGLPPATDAQREAMLRRRVPAYAALMRAGNDRIYACGGEQLKYYARGRLDGDAFGPFSYARVLGGASDTAAIAERLQRIEARSFLVVTRVCPPPRATGGMELVYEDAAAQLWRVDGSGGQRAAR